jgi:hypothetical protein
VDIVPVQQSARRHCRAPVHEGPLQRVAGGKVDLFCCSCVLWQCQRTCICFLHQCMRDRCRGWLEVRCTALAVVHLCIMVLHEHLAGVPCHLTSVTVHEGPIHRLVVGGEMPAALFQACVAAVHHRMFACTSSRGTHARLAGGEMHGASCDLSAHCCAA